MLVLHLELVPVLRAALLFDFNDGDSLFVVDLNWATDDCSVLLMEPIELDFLASSILVLLLLG